MKFKTICSLVTIVIYATATAQTKLPKERPPAFPIGASAYMGTALTTSGSVVLGLKFDAALHIYDFRILMERNIGGRGSGGFRTGSTSELSSTSLNAGYAFPDSRGNAAIPYLGWSEIIRKKTLSTHFSANTETSIHRGISLGVDIDFFTDSFAGFKMGIRVIPIAGYISMGIQFRSGKGRYTRRTVTDR